MARQSHGWGRHSALLAVLAALAVPASASAQVEHHWFFEETAEANWSVPHQCADGSVVQARLLVSSTRDFESPDTADSEPTARVQFLAVCPDGRSFSWGRSGVPATITSGRNLRSVTVTAGPFTVRDNVAVTHTVSLSVRWTGSGPLEVEVDTFRGSRIGATVRKERTATATGTVTFDGSALVSGAANHFLTPFIRVDEEFYVQPPS